MLVMDDGDEICPLSFNMSVGHQHPKDVTNNEIPSPTPENCHQHLCSLIWNFETFLEC